MADFDIKPQTERPENFLGYSRGIDATRNGALGSLFSSVATAVEQGVSEADRLTQEGIRDEIYEETDAIQDEFGVGDATLFQKDAEGKKPLPNELASSGENLDRLQAAYERGALKESHYWARMNSMVRQLRQKHPGYREEIDQMVASVTGARPANALRNALFNEWADAANSESSLSKLEDWATKQGYMPPDYFVRQQNGNPYDKTELQAYVAGKTRDEVETRAEKADLELLSANKTLDTDTAKRSFTVAANRAVSTIMNDTGLALGATYADTQKKLLDAQRAQAAGQPLDPVELNNLRGAYSQVITAARQQLQKALITPFGDNPEHTYAANMTPAEANAIIEQALLPLLIDQRALMGDSPDLGIIGSTIAHNQAIRDRATKDLLENVPIAATLGAVQREMGPDIARTVYSTNPELQTPLVTTLVDYAKGRALVEPGASITQDIAGAEQKGVGAEVTQGMLNHWTALISMFEKGELPMEVYQKNVDYMFGPESQDVMALLDDASKFAYYKKVASPMVSKQMMAMRDAGDTESWDNYQQWVSRNFMTLFQSKIATIQNASTSLLRPGMSVVWDKTSAGFRLITPGGRPPPLVGFPDQLTAEGAVKDLNDAIRVIKPILDTNGGDAGAEVYELLAAMGFSPEDQTDFVGMLMGGIAAVFGTVEEAEAKKVPAGGGSAE